MQKGLSETSLTKRFEFLEAHTEEQGKYLTVMAVV